MNILFRHLLSIIFFCTALHAQAKDDGTDSSALVEKETQSYVVNANGTYVLEHSIVLLLKDARALRALAQYPISYNRTLDTVKITTAYTQKPNGRRVLVSAGEIKDQQEKQSSDAPMFQDTRVKVVIFPEVAVGDKLVLSYSQRRMQPMFPGQFDDLTYAGTYAVKEFSVSYDMPANMKLYSDAVGFDVIESASRPGRLVYRWRFQPGENERLEQDSVAYLDHGKRLAVSTFISYDALGRAYEARAATRRKPGKRIVELANNIISGIAESRAQAYALAGWIRQNIRYVAVYVGPGGIVPHAADTVLGNRYGDCKDHALLLESMLMAVGIDSTTALINAGNAYTLPTAATLGVLNHAITYIPSLDLYIDTTDPSLSMEYLPLNEWDKPTVLTKIGHIGHTPPAQPHKSLRTSTFNIDKNGSAKFTDAESITGWGGAAARYNQRNMNAAEKSMMAERVLLAYGLNGSGEFVPGKFENNDGVYHFSLVGNISNFANLPGPTGIPTFSSLISGVAGWVFSAAAEQNRTQSYFCLNASYDEKSEFVFSPTIRIIGIPKPLEVHDESFDYVSTFDRRDNVVFVTRTLSFHRNRSICTREDFKAIRKVLDNLIKNIKAQIVIG